VAAVYDRHVLSSRTILNIYRMLAGAGVEQVTHFPESGLFITNWAADEDC